MINYDQIAPTYDKFRKTSGPYLTRLVSLAQSSDAQRALEIGAGTGNITSAFLATFPCKLTAIDLSWGMLSLAREKQTPASLIQGSGEALPVRSGSHQFIFAVYMLHFVRDLTSLLSECYRALSRGAVAFITASHDYIERHPMNEYFPSFASIDKARFPAIERVMEEMARAGFSNVSAETFVDEPQPIGREYLARVEGKFISTFNLMSVEEFEIGLSRLRADVEKRGTLDAPFGWESVLISAYK